MNFYFTGTGNSLYAARQLDTENRSIPRVMRGNEHVFSAGQIGVVCPVYGHEMPKMVKEFLRRSTFDTDYLYLVLTYGKLHGGAAELAQSWLESVGKRADYITTVMMVDNFLPAFDMEQETAQDKHVEQQLEAVRAALARRERGVQKATLADRLTHSGYLSMVKNAPETLWANFTVSEECIGCGICTQVCPAGCIHLERQRAVHTGENCQACYACIHACPKTAIHFGRLPMKEPNPQARYRNPHISLTELVQSNTQLD